MRKKAPKAIEYSQANDPMHGYRNVRWVENVSRGLRRVGYADEIARAEQSWRTIDHKGWYTNEDFQDEVYRGIVYQLPARHGLTTYVYGYADPNNDDAALLCFDLTTHKLDAAKQADRFAEIMAEEQRDYNRASCARRRYDDLDDDIREMRREVLGIGAEMRAARVAKIEAPRICAALRGKILSLYRSIQKAREERAELMNNFGHEEGFTE